MSSSPQAAETSGAPKAPKVPVGDGNPVFRMMGLPRIRAKLPSRNWSIFLTVVGSFSAAVIYDRRQRKKTQQKWCNAVSHLSEQSMPTNQLPRKMTIYLSAPPGDGLRAAREHFQEYVKPMLVAAAVDWDVVEGRKEGDVRAGLAERARETRRRSGEPSEMGPEEDILLEIRQKYNIREESGSGDIVLGRHTWKEYIRGLHEGWLGPIDVSKESALQELSPEPTLTPSGAISTPESVDTGSQTQPEVIGTVPSDQREGTAPADSSSDSLSESSQDDTSPTANTETEKQTPAEETAKPKPPSPTPPYILPSAYEAAPLAPSTPPFPNSLALPLPHLLGFLNTPIRIYRFLNRRHLADETGRQVASLLIAPGELEYEMSDNATCPPVSSFGNEGEEPFWEQQRLLLAEEADWHKSARKPNSDQDAEKERPWLEPMFVDTRIGSRMRKPEFLSEPHSQSMLGDTQSDSFSGPGEQTDDGSAIRGNSFEWKGGADRPERVSWIRWLKEAAGFEAEEPKCKGWEHGEVNS